nr:hypothetical protein BaRGS_014434 [Batillaria attramentaria]
MTWVTIGTSGEAFAFSREELPLEEARKACEQLDGGSHLAVLDTTLEEVGNYTLEKYPFRQFWTVLGDRLKARYRVRVSLG